MDEHPVWVSKLPKSQIRFLFTSAIQYLEKATAYSLNKFHPGALYSLMQRLLIIGKYHQAITLLNKYKCWACEEGLPQGNSMHDCEHEFNIQVECHFDEAMFLVNYEIRKRDTYFPGVEMIEGFSFIYIIKQRLYMRTINNTYNIMGC